MPDSVPDGFEPIAITEGFIGHNGPYCWRRRSDGQFEYGFRSDARHANPNGVVHGGALFAFLDTIAGHAVVVGAGRRCATVALDTRFMASTAPGAWISGRASVRKLTRSLAFVEAEASVGDDLLATTSAVFRVFESPPGA